MQWMSRGHGAHRRPGCAVALQPMAYALDLPLVGQADVVLGQGSELDLKLTVIDEVLIVSFKGL
jgi:uncharacterized protein (DUF779 family)